MTAVFLAGCCGILLCAASDAAQLLGLRVPRTVLFYLGCAAQLSSAFLLLRHSRFWLSFSFARVCGLILAAASFGLLIYTLFFSLPKGTYEKNKGQAVYTGIWAICRHPGIWFYFFCTLGLAIAANTRLLWLACPVWSGLDLLYAAWQDKVVFPKTLSGYDRYQHSTPFLIPRISKK